MKNINRYFTKRTILFIAIFTLAGFFALQIPVAQLAGSKAQFTMFDAFAPVAGAFIGNIPGVIAVILMQFFNFLFHGHHIKDAGTIIRFFPILFAVLAFAKKRMLNLAVPAIAIAAFLAHPVGRSVWYFALFWLIPIAMHVLHGRLLFARALCATFTAHAIGGALWIWAFSLPAPVWNALIPVVIVERTVFALGISASFIIMNNFLCFLENKHILNLGFSIDQRYLLYPLRDHHGAKA